MSGFSGLSIAISGLIANKRALDTTSHNISNVNNPNYVRQQVIQSASKYGRYGNFEIGRGVDVQEIRQIRDSFLDMKYRDYSKDYGYWTAKNSVFEQVQDIFNEVSDSGVQKVMDQFWNSWEELSKDPDNLTIRGMVKERGIAFTETVNHLYEQLDSLQINLNKDIKDGVNRINAISEEIANLNFNIRGIEAGGIAANDYRDRRNQLIDELSQMINIEYYEDNTGTVNISVGGKHIVNGNEYSEISAEIDGSSYVDIYWKDTIKKGNPEMVDLRGGELLGLLESRGNVKDTIIKDGNGTVNDDVEVTFFGSYGDKSDYDTDIQNRGLGDIQINEEGFTTGSLDDLVSYVQSNQYEEGDLFHKKIIVSYDGPPSDVTSKNLEILKNSGVSVSIITTEGNMSKWSKVSDATGGRVFNKDDVTAKELSQETTNTVSRHMGKVSSFREVIPMMKKKLNAFVNTIARNMNYVHRQGNTLTGETGLDFFVAIDPSRPIEAGNIMVSKEMDSLNNIAASSTGDRGDGKQAELISKLREEYMFSEVNSDNYYRDIISSMGVAANEAVNMMDNNAIIRGEVDSKRRAISGVSLDEEMTNMLKYQHSYVANSRVINVIDEMIDIVVNRTGKVGR
ncbi:flagellar hook-associated protein FlgK [Clostridiisalibacter paucivorans]|uniref:flagellar hook-associated protein FlgK n=1 Tax=Clostridiisalibacter paucivorans TaxID=408753 RepID=UPI0004797178|nr:flagellar hook-associated protein FlgK [Clostridiisalibacter paucivorans]